MKKLIITFFVFLLAGHLHAAPVSFNDVMNFQSSDNLWHGERITKSGFSYTHDLNSQVDFDTHGVTEASLRLTVWDGLVPVDGKGKFFGIKFDNYEYLRYAFDGSDWVEVEEEIDYQQFVLGVDVGLLNVDGKLTVSLQAWNGLNTADFFLKQSELFGSATEREVPEPATIALLGLGLAGLGMARKRNAA